jgi:hypothetical protein
MSVTRDEVMTLSGRALDWTCALQVMGWYAQAAARTGTPWWAEFDKVPCEGMVMTCGRWHPTTDLNQAVQVAEKAGVFATAQTHLWTNGAVWRVSREAGRPSDNFEAEGATPAEALCRASLMVVEESHDLAKP